MCYNVSLHLDAYHSYVAKLLMDLALFLYLVVVGWRVICCLAVCDVLLARNMEVGNYECEGQWEGRLWTEKMLVITLLTICRCKEG